MSAINFYVNTLSLVLKTRPYECTFTEVYNSFACLRESLLCPICRKLLKLPTRVYTDLCHHNVCKSCTINFRSAIPQCIGCGKDAHCQDNVQLRVVIQCYKKMCKFMVSCGFFQEWTSKSSAAQLQNFIKMTNEGAQIEDDLNFLNSYEKSLESKRLGKLSSECEKDDDTCTVDVSSISSKVENSFCKTKLMDMTESDESLDSSEFVTKFVESHSIQSTRANCHCGLSTRSPGKRTCYGQRCPCYNASRACCNCHCRGCRNPKKLCLNSQGLRNSRAMNPSLQRHRSLGNIKKRLKLVKDETCLDEATTSDEIVTSDSEKES